MFDLQTALNLARICSATYLATEDAFAPLFPDGKVHLLATGDQLTAAIETAERTILSFRGTVTLGAWLKDCEYKLVSLHSWPGKVHYGFAFIVEGIWEWIKNEVSIEKPIVLTGHSLGGALATLTAGRLQEAGYHVESVYTYGSPRVGDCSFAAMQQNVEHHRVTNDLDPFVHVPGIGAGYAHTGTEFHLPVGSATGCWQLLRSLVIHLRQGYGPAVISAVSAHFIDSYIDALEKS